MSAAPELDSRVYTGEDLERLSSHGFRYELVLGTLKPASPAGFHHGTITGKLSTPLQSFVDEHDLGDYFAAGTGFYLARDPDTILAPDWAFIRTSRVPDALPESFAETLPDLVIETRSPSQTRSDVEDKIKQWLDAGVCAVLDVDPRGGTVAIHRPNSPTRTLHADDTLVLEEHFPGLEVALTRVFRRSAG